MSHERIKKTSRRLRDSFGASKRVHHHCQHRRANRRTRWRRLLPVVILIPKHRKASPPQSEDAFPPLFTTFHRAALKLALVAYRDSTIIESAMRTHVMRQAITMASLTLHPRRRSQLPLGTTTMRARTRQFTLWYGHFFLSPIPRNQEINFPMRPTGYRPEAGNRKDPDSN